MKIKVCGLRDAENIKAVAALSPDYMGFIFYDQSPRYVADVPAVVKSIPTSIIKTAVFVNETVGNIDKLIKEYSFEAIQLHGNENPNLCKSFKGRIKVLKAFGLNQGFDFKQLYAYKDCVDFFLFDTKTDIHGGSGKTFDWNMLDEYKLDVPFFLSGGISLENLHEIRKITHPQFYGVDLNSRFETLPGVKDIDKLEQAFAIIKLFDNNEVRS